MYKVYFINHFYTKHFNTEQEALDYAKASGFECAVFDTKGRRIRAFTAY